MNEIAVVLLYFGKLKPSFKLFYESCRRNAGIDWLIFTDNEEPNDRAQNVRWINFSLDEFNRLATEKIGIEIKITNPYKLCDYKPTYGLVFDEYIKGYKYWAFGDIDLIYGDVLSYLEKIKYYKYDKINFAGHFCLMKNVREMNYLFLTCVKGTADFTEIANSGNVAFDERALNKKADILGIKTYLGIFAADIVFEKGMQCVDKTTLKWNFDIKIPDGPKNYRYQLFLSDKGKVVRYYKKFGKIRTDEFCYIHYRRELPLVLSDISTDTFIVSEKGFYEVKTENLLHVKDFMEAVKIYNPRGTFLKDKIGAAKYLIKKILGIRK